MSQQRPRDILEFLRRAKELREDVVTKSGLMLGLGETETEIFQAMDDLREHGVEVLTMGQYLRPTPQHLPVVEYIRPEVFEQFFKRDCLFLRKIFLKNHWQLRKHCFKRTTGDF